MDRVGSRSGSARGGGRRCLRALLRRELGAAWLGALAASAAAGVYVAWGVARAGLLTGDAAAALRAPLLARLVNYPATLAGAVTAAAALLAIVRVSEDRAAAWFAPLAVTGVAPGAYPAAVTLAVSAALTPVFLTGAAAFETAAAVLRGGAGGASFLLQTGVAAAAVLAGACYGVALGGVVRGASSAAILGVALYAVPLVPAILVASGGGEPGPALRLLALPLPALSAAPDAALLLRHLMYAAVALALLIGLGGRLFGRWPR